MFRIMITAVAAACALQCAPTQGQRHWHPSSRHASRPAQSGWFGFGSIGNAHRANPNFGQPGSIPHYGYDYIYDPYRSGRFKAPDLLLNDPFFRTQHKFDSHFPGRYGR